MKTAQDYPITFGYGAQDGVYYGPNGSVGLMHRGNDRATPVGTPIEINGQVIGKTGNTGLSSGPHLHTQAGADIQCQVTTNPSPLEFKPGRVVALSDKDQGQWGKYITLKVGGQYITYAHLSEVSVKIREEVGKTKMLTNNQINVLFRLYRGTSPTASQRKQYVGKVTFDEMQKLLEKGSPYKTLISKANNGTLDAKNFLPTELRTVYKSPDSNSKFQTLADKVKGLIPFTK